METFPKFPILMVTIALFLASCIEGNDGSKRQANSNGGPTPTPLPSAAPAISSAPTANPAPTSQTSIMTPIMVGANFNVGSSTFSALSNSQLVMKDNALTGLGNLLATKTLAGTSTNNSYELDITFPEGSTATLVVNATKTLASGINFTMKKMNGKLQVFAGPENAQVDITSKIAGLTDQPSLRITLDVHNEETPAHVLIFPMLTAEFSEASAIFNSEEFQTKTGKGNGSFWGLRLQNAVVNRAQHGSAKFSE